MGAAVGLAGYSAQSAITGHFDSEAAALQTVMGGVLEELISSCTFSGKLMKDVCDGTVAMDKQRIVGRVNQFHGSNFLRTELVDGATAHLAGRSATHRRTGCGRFQRERTGSRTARHGVNPGMGCTPAMLALMSTQIAVRLPEEVVAFLDKAVADGRATSRAALVSAAVEREMRRQAAEADVEILRKGGAADDLDTLVNWTTGRLDIAD